MRVDSQQPVRLQTVSAQVDGVLDRHEQLLDRTSDAVGSHGIAADAVNGGFAASNAMRQSSLGQVARGLAVGDGAASAEGARRATRGVGRVAARIGARHADDVARVAAPALSASAKLLSLLGRAAPVLGFVSCAYDLSKAVREDDPTQRRAAWGTAALTVGGTAAATAGMVMGMGPAAGVLLAASAAVGAFQLVDTFKLKGRGTAWLADRAAMVINWIKP